MDGFEIKFVLSFLYHFLINLTPDADIELQTKGECSHYAKNSELVRIPGGMRDRSKALLTTINNQFGTLPFCKRYLDRVGETSYLAAVSFSLALSPL